MPVFALFFFKQKTAYDMRISDWSSDVCSSDLLGLYGGDLRAAERSYQLLHQVSGRAGRAEQPGRVLLQTAEPEHPVMQALAAGVADGQGRDRFFAEIGRASCRERVC